MAAFSWKRAFWTRVSSSTPFLYEKCWLPCFISSSSSSLTLMLYVYVRGWSSSSKSTPISALMAISRFRADTRKWPLPTAGSQTRSSLTASLALRNPYDGICAFSSWSVWHWHPMRSFSLPRTPRSSVSLQIKLVIEAGVKTAPSL